MRVVQAKEFGGPEVLAASEAPDPAAGPGQAVIDVAVADVLFLDTQLRRGLGGEYFTVEPPYVPGCGVAGQVASVGEGVRPGWVGQRVVAMTGQQGGYAEQAPASAERLVSVPDGLGLPEAAALLHDGTTALGLVEQARIGAGEWVLITGAGGGLGVLLVQLARAAGAQVIGAARGERKLDLIRQRGAQAAIDYSEPGWAERVRQTTGGGPDVVFDGVGGEIGRAAFEVTVRGGRFSAHGAPSGAFTAIDPHEAQGRGVTVRGIDDVAFSLADQRRLTARALSEATGGRLRPVIGQTFALERAADAHAAIEARDVVGKTVLLI